MALLALLRSLPESPDAVRAALPANPHLLFVDHVLGEGERFVAAVESSVHISRDAGMLRADVTDELALRSLGMAIWAVWNVADRAERERVADEVGALLLRGMLA